MADVADEEDETLADTAAAVLTGKRPVGTVWFAAIEASASGPSTHIDAGVWYAAEPYTDPYSGEIEELTAHLDGISDTTARATHAKVLGDHR